MRLRQNIFDGTVLWSQTPDTDWYRENRPPLPANYIRLVATWPDEESAGLFYPTRTAGTLTGWGREAFFVMSCEGDHELTPLQRKAVESALAEIDAPTAEEAIDSQAPILEGLIATGCLTDGEIETAQKIMRREVK